MLFITSTFQVEQNITKYSQFNLQSTLNTHKQKSDQSKCALVKNVELKIRKREHTQKGDT